MAVLCERWVLTLATAVPGDPTPYATPLFYAVAPAHRPGEGPRLVFASSPTSAHGRHLGDGPTTVAAALYLESHDFAELRGVQLRGEVVPTASPAARTAYLERHPGAGPLLQAGARERLYALAITWAKLTDNRLGFGYKREWSFRTSSEHDEDPPPIPV